ncbi:hypothetical protein BN2475_1270014 [Paraburkholderia ribeironis]|uniref:Uncharacterized protein n=1 Tax=Paraburkholderia ribeironis TaxID=1247936 RepID=A0A1N7SP22_9BURK|nr:hypothetical protein BN2475_1270014 [Paraburkholderia ribeironis]
MVANAILCRKEVGDVVINAAGYAGVGTVVRLQGHSGATGACTASGNCGPRFEHDEFARLFDRCIMATRRAVSSSHRAGSACRSCRPSCACTAEAHSRIATPDGCIVLAFCFPRNIPPIRS